MSIAPTDADTAARPSSACRNVSAAYDATASAVSAICAAVAANSSIVDVVSDTAEDCCVADAACSSAVANNSPADAAICSPPERI